MGKQFKRCQLLEPNFGVPNSKSSGKSLIFQVQKFWEFVNFLICKIMEIFQCSNLENSKNFQF